MQANPLADEKFDCVQGLAYSASVGDSLSPSLGEASAMESYELDRHLGPMIISFDFQ